MKKFFFIISILTTLSAYAVCPLDPSGNSSCSDNIIPSFSPIYEKGSVTGFASQENNLQPLNKQNPLNKMRNPNNRINDALSCPFGICSQGIQSPFSNSP